jgi:hypothetical protein
MTIFTYFRKSVMLKPYCGGNGCAGYLSIPVHVRVDYVTDPLVRISMRKMKGRNVHGLKRRLPFFKYSQKAFQLF